MNESDTPLDHDTQPEASASGDPGHEELSEPPEPPSEVDTSPVVTDSAHVEPSDDKSAPPAQEAVLKGDVGVEKALTAICVFIMIILGGIAFSNIFMGPFFGESQRLIVDNEPLHRIATFSGAMDVEPALRPLTMFTFALNWRFSEFSPVGFRVVNLLLHLLNGVLVFLLCKRLFKCTDAVAMVAGLLFLVHPATAESVNYIVGRSGLLVTTFTLLALLSFLRTTRNTERLSFGLLAFSLTCFVLAWASDKAGLGIPILILVADLVVSGPRMRLPRLAIHAMFWAVLLVLLCIQQQVLDVAAVSTASPPAFFDVFWEYLRLAAAPRELSVEHYLAPPGIFGGPPISMGLMAFILLAIATLVLLVKRSPLGFGLFLFLVTLNAMGPLLPADLAVSERALYLPLAGAVLVAPWLIEQVLAFRSLRKVIGVAAAVLILAAATGTFYRNATWHSAEALWTDAKSKSPAALRPTLELGKVHFMAGEGQLQRASEGYMSQDETIVSSASEEATRAFEMSRTYFDEYMDQVEPDSDVLRMYGELLTYLGEHDEALTILSQALKSDLANDRAALRLAGLLIERGRRTGDIQAMRQAIQYFRHVEQHEGLNQGATVQFATALAGIGDVEGAAGLLAKLVKEDPETAATAQLNDLRQRLNQVEELRQRAVAIRTENPSNFEWKKLIGQSLAMSGYNTYANYYLTEYLHDGARDASAWAFLGYVRGVNGNAEDFLKEWPSPPEDPAVEARAAWLRLATMCAMSNSWETAMTYLESPQAQSSIEIPGVAAGEVALDMGDYRRAEQLYREAAEKNPQSPLPWLRLANLGINMKDFTAARGFISEAEKRAAPQDEIEALRARLEVDTTVPQDDGMTIIR